jgi:two-component system, LytTR family, response regulator
MNRIRTLVVDDHPLARRRLISLLESEMDVEVVGECRNGQEAVAALRDAQPDLVFLDVQMPELDGFDVVRTIDADTMPLVIFVTAYDEYALQAFEVHALDYLLKPFNNDRFRRALSHARSQLDRHRTEDFSRRLLALVREVQPSFATPERLMLRTDGRVLFIDPAQIMWVEAEGNYLRLYLDEGSHVLRRTMKDLEARMGKRFLRIHRSHVVNINQIAELRTGGGDLEVLLKDGTPLKVGQSFRDHVEERMRRG